MEYKNFAFEVIYDSSQNNNLPQNQNESQQNSQINQQTQNQNTPPPSFANSTPYYNDSGNLPPSRARITKITTPHGQITTPAFIFCGTKASVKGIFPSQLKQHKTQIILSNTYHLMLNPGAEHIKKMGGIHKFMGWDGPILTDSGGFQIFSLGHGSVANEIKRSNSNPHNSLVKITEEGAIFKSYLDGSIQNITPESSITAQNQFGTDFVVCFDECTPFNVEKSYTQMSMQRSHRWEARSFEQFLRIYDEKQALYGIIQGGIYQDLRKQSVDFINDTPFFGTAIGGSLGGSKKQMYEVVDMAMQNLTRTRPIHLLGIGGISDIFNCVLKGIDTFDCVHPTRIARHGCALVKHCNYIGTEKINNNTNNKFDNKKEHINLKNAIFKCDENPIESGCNCETCRSFSKGYLHYLLKAKELLALHAICIHNIYFMNKLMQDIREAIYNERIFELKKEYCEG